MKIFPRQGVTRFLTLFEEAISRAEVQGNVYDDERKKAMIEEALENGEPELGAFSASLQLAADLSWNQVRERCNNFDYTSKGIARLTKVKIKASESQR